MLFEARLGEEGYRGWISYLISRSVINNQAWDLHCEEK